jgi:hypothetical protein
MAVQRQKTIGQAVEELKELDGKVAVLTAAIGYFRTRYIGRDSSMPIAQLKGRDGSPVDEAIIELQVNAWEDEVRDMEETAVSYRAEPVSG